MGAYIACATPTDYLIAAGVSNWGANGLAAATAVMAHEHGRLEAILRHVATIAQAAAP